ncbi:MAG: phosphoglycerate mutase (2,3-diphosphoglycerate-independent) [Syntrophales bacterium]|nr:phosphoglycerate mutase (2,3-diphosphoglycerate-independent) [Syntrophales bacterium]
MPTRRSNAMSRAVRDAYRRGEDDETLNPLVLTDPSGRPAGRIGKGDAVIFYNIRGEREVELSRSLTEDGFREFPTAGPLGLHYATMIEYSRELKVDVAFPPEEELEDTLSEVHIENEPAVMRAVEAVDSALGRVVDEARKAGVPVLVTADHGTVERWLYPDGAVDTGHTASPVPFLLVSAGEPLGLRAKGELTDVAPTILELFGIAPPARMEGKSLLERTPATPCRRLVVLILDGWGYNPETRGNLIARASTPVMDGLLTALPFSVLAASGEAVGLPAGTVGNSEAGHLHIGAGRRVFSDRLKIDRAIESGTFFSNGAYRRAMAEAVRRGRALHLMGIVSFFSSHGMMNHLLALMDMAKQEGVPELYIHAMLGRRGEMPESGANYVKQIEDRCADLGLGRVVSVIGRYWSMDREENWDRIEKTYRMLVHGDGFAVKEGV